MSELQQKGGKNQRIYTPFINLLQCVEQNKNKQTILYVERVDNKVYRIIVTDHCQLQILYFIIIENAALHYSALDVYLVVIHYC